MLAAGAQAHGIAGKRFFPSTITTEDPFASDELSIIGGHIKEPAEDHHPKTVVSELEGHYSKRVFPNFALSVGDHYVNLKPDDGESEGGAGNLEVGGKLQFFKSDPYEAVASIGVDATLGGTGTTEHDEPHTILSPALFFGLGAGTLPDSLKYARPLALTGVVGASFPTDRKTRRLHIEMHEEDGGPEVHIESEIERNPTTLDLGFSLQYNLQYLQSFVEDVGLIVPFNRMVPLVELALSHCLSGDCEGETTGFVNPGVIWFGKYFQLGAEARFPLNDRTGDNVGAFAQIHFFLDDIFPQTIGRPLFP
jgi:hypothetical protein